MWHSCLFVVSVLVITVNSSSDKCSLALDDSVLTCSDLGEDTNPGDLLTNVTYSLELKDSETVQISAETHQNGSYEQLRSYQIVNNKLLEIDSRAFEDLSDLRHIAIRKNTWSTLKNETFASLSNLEMLIIEDNGIEQLEPKAFSDLKKLFSLTLTGNNFSVLPGEIFEDLGSLDSLLLYDNNIERIEDGALAGLVSLILLDLSHNRLKLIHADGFLNTPMLKLLYLGYNQIEDVLGVFRCENLQFLDLKCNKLGKVPDSLFKFSSKLVSIDLLNNSISELSAEPFKDLPRLVFLNVRSNSIRNLYSLKRMKKVLLVY